MRAGHTQIFNKPLKDGLKSSLLPLPPLGVRTAEGFAAGISPGAEQWALGTPDPRGKSPRESRPSGPSRSAGTGGSETVHNAALNLAARLTCFN